MSHFVISGAPVPPLAGSGVPNRLEINDFVKDEKMFSLYIQALAAASNDNQSNLISFFQIGGIHGLPYIPWDGAGTTDPAGTWGGYCTHGTSLFPTWHRPYLALIEQVLQSRAAAIAATYTVDQATWRETAAALRQPYWDWAKNIDPPPEVVSLAKVTITAPDGRRTEVNNPLVGYRFHPIDDSFDAPYSNWPTTLRWPTSQRPDAKSDIKALTTNLSNEQKDVRMKTSIMLTRVHTWPDFSNHTAGPGKTVANSLETIHDQIHNLVGGGGHMSDPAVAGFDPIFFLHHAQVDRLLALWSALNPGVWVSQDQESDGTFTIPDGAKIDEHTPLTPFWNSQNAYWTSSGNTTTLGLGYSYPEFNGLDLSNPAAVQARIEKIIDDLYSPTSHLPLRRRPAADVAVEKIQSTANPGHAKIEIEGSNAPSAATPEGMIWEWTARTRVKHYELGTSFVVLIFIGEVPEDPTQWRSSPSYVGAHYTFVNSARGHCANCNTQDGLVVEGFVHLQTAIAERSGLGGFDPHLVGPYLQENLHWRVQKMDGAVVPLEDVPSLEVTVVAVPLTLPPGARFPDVGEAVHHHHVTANKPGGSRSTE